MSASPVIHDLIATLEHPGAINAGLAHQVSEQLALLEERARPSHRPRRISPFPVRRVARAGRRRSARERSLTVALAAPTSGAVRRIQWAR